VTPRARVGAGTRAHVRVLLSAAPAAPCSAPTAITECSIRTNLIPGPGPRVPRFRLGIYLAAAADKNRPVVVYPGAVNSDLAKLSNER